MCNLKTDTVKLFVKHKWTHTHKKQTLLPWWKREELIRSLTFAYSNYPI